MLIVSPKYVTKMVKSQMPPHMCFEWVAAFCIAVITHLYFFTNKLINEDMLAFVTTRFDPLGSGRWSAKFFQIFQSNYMLPVVIGVVCFSLLALSVCAVNDIFQLQKKSFLILMAALMVTFPTLSQSFGYQFMASTYSFSLFLSVLSVWITAKYKYGFVIGAVCLAFSMGGYQAYVACAMTLSVLKIILYIIDKKAVDKAVGIYISRYLLMGVMGVAGYFAGLKIRLYLTGTQLLSYKGMDTMGQIELSQLPEMIFKAYKRFVGFFMGTHLFASSFLLRIVYLCVILLTLALLVNLLIRWFDKRQALVAGGVIAVFLCILPLCVNIVDIMSAQASSDSLTAYPLVFVLSFPLALMEQMERESTAGESNWQNSAQWALYLTGIFMACSFFISSNIYYLKLDVYSQRTVLLNQRIFARIEQLPEFSSKTPIAIFANNSADVYGVKENDFTDIKYDRGLWGQFIGMKVGNEQSASWKFSALTKNLFGVPTTPADAETIAQIRATDEYLNMGVWPAQDSIAVIDGTIVVNFLYQIDIDVQLNAENEITFSLKGGEALPEGCTYAWYLYKDGKRTNVQWYQEKPVYVTGQLEAGEYYTTLFIKDSNGEAVCNVTSDKYKL